MADRLDVRAAVRDRIERGIRALNPDAPDPEQLAEIALAALADGCEWLMSLAEEYQQRAHAAEKSLAELRGTAATGPACSECGGRPKRGLIQSEDGQSWQCEGCYHDLASGPEPGGGEG